jgi:hypothetical protein
MRPNTKSREKPLPLQKRRHVERQGRSPRPGDGEVPERRRSTQLTGDRLLTPLEVERAVNDQVLLPLQTLPLSAVLKILQQHVDDEGGVMRLSRLIPCSPSVLSDAIRGARGGIGRAAAKYLGLKPTILRVMAYRVVEPRKFYRPSATLNILSRQPKTRRRFS